MLLKQKNLNVAWSVRFDETDAENFDIGRHSVIGSKSKGSL